MLLPIQVEWYHLSQYAENTTGNPGWLKEHKIRTTVDCRAWCFDTSILNQQVIVLVFLCDLILNETRGKRSSKTEMLMGDVVSYTISIWARSKTSPPSKTALKEAGVIKRSMWNTLGKNKSFVKWTCVQMVRDGKNNIWQVKCRTSKHTNPTKQCKGKWNTKNVQVIKLAWVVLKKSGAGELNCWSQQRLVHSKGMGWPEDGSLSRRKSSELFAYVFPLKEPGGVHTGILPYGELHRKSVLNRSAFRRD